ncbi:MAG: DNA polymerase III subunit gamma and tau [Propionibacteriales bacterium]|nr:DNA polymerase III subunit gamma and tau [Propionibacteriales bacterium]
MDAPLALYRRYRPDTFVDVIGQAHVTGPLSAALENNRVSHAYLFSGPRGCGKTTSARILARALNCETGPSPTPCGTCESCVELARGGPGSVDVIEIDAASHGGVDDARELRERAFFAPMKARYKVYIIDEAHMVTTQGFNALLKLVEEPPAHLRFIFATTEPDKVIGTIRSRTHHYPFRLVPPKVLGDYLLDLCALEGVTIEPTVVPLIVRAGAGSVRDSLSVLDQLIGGSGPEGVSYSLATALLGYTPDSLIDQTIDALAADDGGTLFAVIDKVIDTGQDPRRFAEDLLHRLRDLVVISTVPPGAIQGLLELSGDQVERLSGQAARFGRPELTRAADIVSQGLTDMRGATAPRLLLELMCARILLPGIDSSAEGLGARVARLERRLSGVGEADHAAPARSPSRPLAPSPSPSQPLAAPPAAVDLVDASPAAETQPARQAAQSPAALESNSSEAPPAPVEVAGLSLVDVRQLWPGVLDRVKKLRRYTWILLSQNAHVKDVADRVITIGLVNSGARDNFLSRGGDEILRQALIDELGVDWRVEAIIDIPDSNAPSRTAREHAGPTAPAPAVAPADERRVDVEAAKEAIRPTRNGASKPAATHQDDVSEVRDDDEIVDDAALSSHDLLARELGAQIIDDIRHDSA